MDAFPTSLSGKGHDTGVVCRWLEFALEHLDPRPQHRSPCQETVGIHDAPWLTISCPATWDCQGVWLRYGGDEVHSAKVQWVVWCPLRKWYFFTSWGSCERWISSSTCVWAFYANGTVWFSHICLDILNSQIIPSDSSNGFFCLYLRKAICNWLLWLTGGICTCSRFGQRHTCWLSWA